MANKAPGEAEKRLRGRPPTVGQGKGAGELLALRVSSDLQKRVDRWRKAQDGKPGRSEAVRRLLDSALKVAGF